MNNNFKNLFDEFLRNLPIIRKEMGLNDILTKTSEFVFDGKLANNENLMNEIKGIFKSVGRKVFLIAPTNSGKTYTILNTFNELEKENGVIAINVIVTPKRIQNVQNETIYGNFNTMAVIGGVNFKLNDIMENKTYSIVYDKIDILLDIKKEIETHFDKKVKFNIVVDEVHDLIKHQFRNTKANPCLDRIRDTLKELEDISNIILMTGTFSNCYSLDFDEIIFCQPKAEYSVETVKLFYCPQSMEFSKFSLNRLVDILKEGNNKLCVRVNSFIVIENLQASLKLQGYNVEVLTSKDKEEKIVEGRVEYKSKTYAQLVNGIFPDVDVLLCTCILDEGSNIVSVENGKKANIVPIFLYDNNNFSMLDAKQFFARVRFGVNNACFICDKVEERKDEYDVGETLLDIVKNEMKVYRHSYESFKAFLEATKMIATDIETGDVDWEAVDKQMISTLNYMTAHGRKSNLNNVIRYENHVVVFDYNKCMNDMYDKYERQLINLSFMKKLAIEKIFSCKIEEVFQTENELEVIDYKDTIFAKELASVKECLEVINSDEKEEIEGLVSLEKVNKQNLLEQRLEEIKAIGSKDSEIFTSLVNYVDVNEVVKAFEEDKQEDLLRNYVVEEVKALDKDEIKAINERIAGNDTTLTPRAERVVKSECYSLMKQGVKCGMNLTSVIKLFENGIVGVGNYIREEQIININKDYERGSLTPGIAANEQIVMIKEIKKARSGKIEFTITDDLVEKLVVKLSKTTGQNWSKLGVRKFIKEVYIFSETKKRNKYKGEDGKEHTTTITTLKVKGLRKQHTN